MNFIRLRARCVSGLAVTFAVFAGMAFGQSTPAKTFSGAAALNFTAKAVAFGPRPSGSAANVKLRAYIHAQLAGCGCQVSSDSFTAQTPDGAVAMENIIAKFPGKSGRAIAITGHFDTKKMTDFVGANDGGFISSFSTAKKRFATGPQPTASTAAATLRKSGRPMEPIAA